MANEQLGEIVIAPRVLEKIIAIATAKVEGVHSFANKSMSDSLSMRTLGRGVALHTDESAGAARRAQGLHVLPALRALRERGTVHRGPLRSARPDRGREKVLALQREQGAHEPGLRGAVPRR